MTIIGALREELSALIPGADFAPYLSFIESRPQREKSGLERHHILPRKEFPAHVKNPDNLIFLSPEDHLRAHYQLALCAPNFVPFQIVFYLMSNWNQHIFNLTESELHACVETYKRGKEAHREWSRTHGQLQGRKNIESGHIQALGKLQGKKNVENVHRARLNAQNRKLYGYLGGRVSGRKNRELSRGFFAPGMAAKGGRIGGSIAGRKAVESGQLASIRTPENWAKALKKLQEIGWPKELGRRNVESGQLAKIRPMGSHTRWHVNRGITNPKCSLCGGENV